jgi:hypothetical protein
MLDYLLTFALIFMIISHSILIRGCFKINGQMETGSHEFSNQFGAINETLSECLDCLDDIAGGNTEGTQNQASGESVQSMILSALMSRMNMTDEHGSEARQERTVQENEQTQNEQIQGSSVDSSDIGDSS